MVLVVAVLGLVGLFAAAAELGKRSLARSDTMTDNAGEGTPMASGFQGG